MNKPVGRAEPKYQVLDIIRGTTVDGPGFRTAIYLAGCRHHCKGCHNPESWNPKAGREMTIQEIMEIVREEEFDVTLTGGDPLYNPDKTILLARAIRNEGFNIWLYTGYTMEEIRSDAKLAPILQYVDVIVDGPYIEEEYENNLKFKGSRNQNIIKLSGM